MTVQTKQPLSQIESPTDSYVARYPWAEEYAVQQQSIFWPAEELGVEEDENDFKISLNAAERHGVLYAQSIITQFELMIGGTEMWGGKIAKMFPRPEIQRMCACFANVELGSHAPFYALGNKVMGNHNDEFYTNWKSDPVLVERIKFISKCASSKDALRVTAALTILEGMTIFTLLGFFKGFNARGHNFIPHFVSGIDGSTKDENFHSLASARLFQECKKERIEAGNHTPEQETALRIDILQMLEDAYAFDCHLIDQLFSIPGNRVITKQDDLEFLQDRANVMCERLSMRAMFNRKPGVITGWFYDQISSVKVPDFFAATQLQYTRNWRKQDLIFDRSLLNAN